MGVRFHTRNLSFIRQHNFDHLTQLRSHLVVYISRFNKYPKDLYSKGAIITQYKM